VHIRAVSSEQIDAPLLPPEPMAEPKSVRLGFVTGLVAVDKLQVLSLPDHEQSALCLCIKHFRLFSRL